MKNKILQVIGFVQENQSGIFKIAILLIMLYWTQIFCDISKHLKNIDLSSVETDLNIISEKLTSIDLTLAH